MAVFRVEKNKGYTVMSNHHLRNKELSLKAKGLLSQMLSLPEDWDYTLAGLSLINREKIDAIREAVRELENAGYIQRSRERDEKGCLRGTTYVIYEQPPKLDLPTLEKPTLDNPTLEKPMLEKPTLENPTQLNKELLKTNLPTKEKLNTDISSTHSIPFHSLNPSPLEDAAQPPERKRKETTDAYSVYEEIIKDNIEYDYLIQDRYLDRDRIEEILALILETVCTKRRTIRIAGDDHPAELVKAKFMKLNSEHIRFVLDCIQDDCIRKNPFDFQLNTVLEDDTEPKEPLSPTQEAAFLSFVQHDKVYQKYYDEIIILLGTGLRISELCGLTEADIDLDKQLINVDHQLLKIADVGYYVETPKTKSGNRVIPMSEKVLEAFQRVLNKRKYAQPIILEGYTKFLFLNRNGLPKVAVNYESMFRGLVRKYNKTQKVALPKVMTPHTLRHTFCTTLANAGMNPKALQYIMGHSNINMTLNYYAHTTSETSITEMKRLIA